MLQSLLLAGGLVVFIVVAGSVMSALNAGGRPTTGTGMTPTRPPPRERTPRPSPPRRRR